MPAVGRPCKLDPERHAALVAALEAGAYRETAARGANIGVSTLYRWLEQGEADHEDGRESAFRELWEAATRAEAVAEHEALDRVLTAGREDWRAAAWYLERKAPGRWGRAARPAETAGEERPVTFADLAAAAIEE